MSAATEIAVIQAAEIEKSGRSSFFGSFEAFEVRKSDLRQAADYWRHGQKGLALHYLERALPSDFSGIATLATD